MTVNVKGNYVHFVFYRPQEPKAVFVVGDFNNWGEGERIPMTRDHQGYWHGKAKLQEGTYRFKYLTDSGEWFPDFAAFGVEYDQRGNLNSVIAVGQSPSFSRRGKEGLATRARPGN